MNELLKERLKQMNTKLLDRDYVRAQPTRMELGILHNGSSGVMEIPTFARMPRWFPLDEPSSSIYGRKDGDAKVFVINILREEIMFYTPYTVNEDFRLMTLY